VSESWVPATTHVVCAVNEIREARRTLKYMQVCGQAAAAGMCALGACGVRWRFRHSCVPDTLRDSDCWCEVKPPSPFGKREVF
jgi:hypothetical protein